MTHAEVGNLSSLDNFGERMVSSISHATVFWAHAYRYRFATSLCRERRVLDIACGEGYGSAGLIKTGAKSVIGMDIAPAAVANAAEVYGIDARIGDAESIPLPDQSVDVVVSFETIGHLRKPALFISECARVLVPNGMLVISTPNREGAIKESSNSHHEQDLTVEQFEDLILDGFSHCEMDGQVFRSAPWRSSRSLVAERALWFRIRGFQRLRRYATSAFRSATTNELSPDERSQLPEFIASKQFRSPDWLNNYAIRKFRKDYQEIPAFLIGVARRLHG